MDARSKRASSTPGGVNYMSVISIHHPRAHARIARLRLELLDLEIHVRDLQNERQAAQRAFEAAQARLEDARRQHLETAWRLQTVLAGEDEA
jgi:FtsZ-binding cell division protein ZapB